ncbi:type II toxin-antitoxin system PemK/MazF family toxin [Leifsonia soli]|uniref:Type II toxin-antitoxin system PemK/MazF family toxin n=1 Tax=Leifsonia soli TaxID=582665 RepID=A0A852SYK3_9MICO|nr:hypothetical protein [Leifsonia soli]
MASVRSVLSALGALFRPSRTARTPSRPAETVQVDPSRLGRIRTSYNPSLDGDADPGEIVWTWVPYEEADGRGKDRPVLVVAAEPSGSVLAVALTSQEHPGRAEYLPIGSGEWDGRGRPSFVRLDRVFRVAPGGLRREGAALDARRFDTVRRALAARYGWS